MRKFQPLERTHRFVLLLRGAETCEQYSTVQHILCFMLKSVEYLHTRRCFNETVRICAFQLIVRVYLLPLQPWVPHPSKCKCEMFTINIESKCNLSMRLDRESASHVCVFLLFLFIFIFLIYSEQCFHMGFVCQWVPCTVRGTQTSKICDGQCTPVGPVHCLRDT